ncbi:MAG: ATP synthase F0 subunit C [Bacteroidales bacterium]
MFLSTLLQAVVTEIDPVSGTSLGFGIAELGASLGASLSAMSAALGISRIGSSALESISRQPETADVIRTNMIILAGLIEGVSLFAIVVCLLIVLG